MKQPLSPAGHHILDRTIARLREAAPAPPVRVKVHHDARRRPCCGERHPTHFVWRGSVRAWHDPQP